MDSGVDIIIVNYFSLHKIRQLLESIFENKLKQGIINTIIVSNSNEDELGEIKNDSRIKIIINKTNLGYGAACNEALTYCTHEYVLVLNPDTILQSSTLQSCYNYMQQQKDITVLGVKHLDLDGKVAVSCSRFPALKNYFYDVFGLDKIAPKIFPGPTLMTDWDHLSSRNVPQVMGAFMFIRKSYIDANGFMDDRFFMYGEDVDFCKTVWEKGGSIFYNADIEIIHEGSASTENISTQKLCYLLESRLICFNKHYPKWKYNTLFFIIAVIEPFSRTIFALIRWKFADIKTTFTAYKLFWKRRNFK